MIISKFERLISFRYLRSRKSSGFVSLTAMLSFLGIAIGVATLIVVMAVMNGFRIELMERILGINSHINISSYSSSMSDYDRLARDISALRIVHSAIPVLQGQAMASSDKGTSTGALIRGVRPQDLERKKIISGNITSGSMDNFAQGSVLIGESMARSLGLSPGDNITLISPSTTQTFFGAMPRLKKYPVAGFFASGLSDADSIILYLPLKDAQLYFNMRGRVSSIEVNATDINAIEEAKAQISQLLEGEYNVTDWRSQRAELVNALKVERNVMFLILTLIIIVAAFNVISGMVMLVTSKGKEIAILRTIGAGRGAIMRIFFLSGATIGVMGTMLGIALGLGFAANIESIRKWLEGVTGTTLFDSTIYFLSQLPAKVQVEDVAMIGCMSLAISLLAPIFPAWRAAKTDPVEGLRYES